MVDVLGSFSPGFENLAQTFSKGFEGREGEMGAACSVWLDGKEVVNIYSGYADPRSEKIWGESTKSVIFSCTKGIMAILAAHFVQKGDLGYERPVAYYWPEFGQSGKNNITVSDVLSHKAGLPAFRNPISKQEILCWNSFISRVEKEPPLWPRGLGYSYHALTYGWLVGEILHRVSGGEIRELLDSIVNLRLGVKACIGLPESKKNELAHVTCSQEYIDFWKKEKEADSDEAPNWYYRSMTLGGAFPATLVTDNDGFNDYEVLRAGIPGAGCVTSASDLAKIFSATVVETDGVRLLDETVLDKALIPTSVGCPIFPTTGPYPSYGMGFQLDSPARNFLSIQSFGHDGAGGQVVFADRKRRMSFSYVTNYMGCVNDQRASSLIKQIKLLDHK